MRHYSNKPINCKQKLPVEYVDDISTNKIIKSLNYLIGANQSVLLFMYFSSIITCYTSCYLLLLKQILLVFN